MVYAEYLIYGQMDQLRINHINETKALLSL